MENKQENAQSTVAAFCKKLTSRKFILSAIGAVTGICGIIGFSDNTTAVIAFIALEVLSLLGYIISEGKVDAASVQTGIKVAEEVAKIVKEMKENGEAVVPTNSDEMVNDDLMPKLKD